MVPRRQLPQREQQPRCPVVLVECLDDLRAADRLPLLHLPEQRPVPAEPLTELPQAVAALRPQYSQLFREPLTWLLAPSGDHPSLRHSAHLLLSVTAAA